MKQIKLAVSALFLLISSLVVKAQTSDSISYIATRLAQKKLVTDNKETVVTLLTGNVALKSGSFSISAADSVLINGDEQTITIFGKCTLESASKITLIKDAATTATSLQFSILKNILYIREPISKLP